MKAAHRDALFFPPACLGLRDGGWLRDNSGDVPHVPFSLEVTEHGKAAAGDLRPGDVIVTINGESAAEMLNVEAQNKIKQSLGQLQLQVERWVLGWVVGRVVAARTPGSPVLSPRGLDPQPHVFFWLFFPSGDSRGCAISAGACPGSVIKESGANEARQPWQPLPG